MSGLDLPGGMQIRKGAGSAVIGWLEADGKRLPSSLLAELEEHTAYIAQSGGTPLVVATRSANGEGQILGVVHLKEIVKDGLSERFAGWGSTVLGCRWRARAASVALSPRRSCERGPR